MSGFSLDCMARLAALVPSPPVNLIPYHGVFAPPHRLRARIVARDRGRDLQSVWRGAQEHRNDRNCSTDWSIKTAFRAAVGSVVAISARIYTSRACRNATEVLPSLLGLGYLSALNTKPVHHNRIYARIRRCTGPL